ncbi:hypothetical protein BOX15_Mlig021025g1, partial [Macrostomum lignano]
NQRAVMTAGMVKAPVIVPLRPPVIGRPKSQIDSGTRIELHSESPEVNIFFTVDGSKPDPFSSMGRRSTYKYKQPFLLPPGKRTVKAVAFAKDGTRESNTVTKTFDVESTNPADVEEALACLEDMRLASTVAPAASAPGAATAAGTDRDDARRTARSLVRRMLADHEAWDAAETDRTLMLESPTRSAAPQPPAMTAVAATAGFYAQSEAPGSSANRFGSGVGLRDTDLVKCLCCLAPRPADPSAKFCYSCGQPVPPLPPARYPQPEPGSLGPCPHCGKQVPLNLPKCIVCDQSFATPQPQPPVTMRVPERRVCQACGTANPPQFSVCLTCEAQLPAVDYTALPLSAAAAAAAAAAARQHSDMPPRPPNQPLDALIACGRCTRLNSPDARFCDWCGARPDRPELPGQLCCRRCSALSPASAGHCGACGATLEPPIKAGWLPASAVGSAASFAQPLASAFYGRPRSGAADAATQTVGLFYPSAAGLRKLDATSTMSGDPSSSQSGEVRRERVPFLTSVSPGRGYWRKQIDHVVAHLKVYTNNNTEFRALIGEPRMGRLMHGRLTEDGDQLHLQLTFALKDDRDPFRPGSSGPFSLADPAGYFKRIPTSSAAAAGAANGDLDSYRSEASSVVSGADTKRTGRKAKRGSGRPKSGTIKEGREISAADQSLIRECGSKGEARPEEVRRLITEQSADPNARNKNGVPVLTVAVRNLHIEAVRELLEQGADANIQGKEKGNTPLHEAILKGYDGQEIVDLLLRKGADINKLNENGETPQDMAKRVNQHSAIVSMTSTIGQANLGKMLKPRGQANANDDDL